MSEIKKIDIKDFNLFYDVIKSAQKIVPSAKLIFNENELQIFGAHEKIARCEIFSNSVTCSEQADVCIQDIGMLVKILGTIKNIHENDYTDFEFTIEKPFIKFKSKKFKTKLTTCNLDVIEQHVSDKIKTEMEPVFEFTTTSELLKRISSHAFIFTDPNAMRIYLETSKEMENNTVYATLGNKETNLNNEITLKMGLVTYGTLDQRSIVLDLDRLSLFNACPCNDLKISLMNKNVLVSKSKLSGKNDSYFNMNIYNSILKA